MESEAGAKLAEGIRSLKAGALAEAQANLLETVALDRSTANRYPLACTRGYRGREGCKTQGDGNGLAISLRGVCRGRRRGMPNAYQSTAAPSSTS